MDLGNAFQVILFLLPGFLLISAFLLFIPARHGTSETAVIASSIAGTAIIWLFASVILLIAQGIATAAGWALNQGWHPNLWSALIAPALSCKSPLGSVLAFGLVLNLLAAVSGAILAGVLLDDQRGIRILEIRRGPSFVKRLRLDLTPRVWNWFFQGAALRAASMSGLDLPRTIYRVTLSDHSILIGEVTEYSLDPNDDELDLVGSTGLLGLGWLEVDTGPGNRSCVDSPRGQLAHRTAEATPRIGSISIAASLCQKNRVRGVRSDCVYIASYFFDGDGNETGNAASASSTYDSKNQTTAMTDNGKTLSSILYADVGQTQRTSAGSTSYASSPFGVQMATTGGSSTYWA